MKTIILVLLSLQLLGQVKVKLGGGVYVDGRLAYTLETSPKYAELSDLKGRQVMVIRHFKKNDTRLTYVDFSQKNIDMSWAGGTYPKKVLRQLYKEGALTADSLNTDALKRFGQKYNDFALEQYVNGGL